MVFGIETFREHFRAFTDHYVLIGGTACELVLESVGLEFRGTKDFDIVVWVDPLAPEFVEAVTEFISRGAYGSTQRTDGSPRLYRFINPEAPGFPTMLELFARSSIEIPLPKGQHITPLSVDGSKISLSAILLDEVYEAYIRRGVRVENGLSFLAAPWLLALKARAFLDLLDRKEGGERELTKLIKKHKNDVARLFSIITPGTVIDVPPQVSRDIEQFVRRVQPEGLGLASLGIKRRTLEEFATELMQLYT